MHEYLRKIQTYMFMHISCDASHTTINLCLHT